jgi:hypothetical protein
MRQRKLNFYGGRAKHFVDVSAEKKGDYTWKEF